MRKGTNDYPDNWKIIATAVKDLADWKCVRCGWSHEPATGHCLTVHHLDMDKNNCNWFNLAALCQKCHLQIQSKVIMERPYFFEHSAWFKPYVAGYYAFQNGRRHDRPYVMAHIEELIALGQQVRA